MSDGPRQERERRRAEAHGPGARLKEAREARGLKLEDAAEVLGVADSVVAALEAEEFERLGAPVYVRGYLRKYARLLGLSGDELVAAYGQVASPHDPEVHAHATTALPQRRNARWLAPATAVILVLVLVLVGLWGWRRIRQNSSPAHVPAAAVSAAMALSRVQPIAEGTHAAASATAVRSQAGASRSGAAAAPAGVHLELDVDTPCWVEVYAPDGERLYYNLASAGQQLSFDAASGALTVFLGNADGVKVLVDGRPFPLPASVRNGNTARFQVGSEGSSVPATGNGT